MTNAEGLFIKFIILSAFYSLIVLSDAVMVTSWSDFTSGLIGFMFGIFVVLFVVCCCAMRLWGARGAEGARLLFSNA